MPDCGAICAENTVLVDGGAGNDTTIQALINQKNADCFTCSSSCGVSSGGGKKKISHRKKKKNKKTQRKKGYKRKKRKSRRKKYKK